MGPFLTLWIKVLWGWEEHPTLTLPTGEIFLLVHALQSMKDHTVLQHPRVAVSNTSSPPQLYVPVRKRKKKFENVEALAAQYETTIQTYLEQGWDIIYPDGSSEKHPEVGWTGGYGVFFGDQRDTAEHIPLGEDQTNNRGELRAALHNLQGHRVGHQSLICPDSLLLVNGVLGWAQRWRRHGWQNTSGAVAHVDLWTQVLHPVEQLGDAIKWLHVPSHISVKGNGRADHLADVGRCRSPLLFGLIFIRPTPPMEDEDSDHEQEKSMWGWNVEYISQPASAPSTGMVTETPPGSQLGTPAKPWFCRNHSLAPLPCMLYQCSLPGASALPPVSIFCDALLVLVAGQGRGEHHSQTTVPTANLARGH